MYAHLVFSEFFVVGFVVCIFYLSWSGLSGLFFLTLQRCNAAPCWMTSQITINNSHTKECACDCNCLLSSTGISSCAHHMLPTDLCIFIAVCIDSNDTNYLVRHVLGMRTSSVDPGKEHKQLLQHCRCCVFLFFFLTLLLSSFWTSRGHRCRPFFPPVLAFNFYRA